MGLKKRMERDEFIKWWVESKDEFSLTEHELRVYRTISEANVHSALFGCPIWINMPHGKNSFSWTCGAGPDCPKVKPVYYRGIIPPSQETINKSLREAGWVSN